MQEFEPLIGRWHGEGELPVEPPMQLTSDATIERLGEFVVFRSTGEPAAVPDTSRSSARPPRASRIRCTTSTRAGSSGGT